MPWLCGYSPVRTVALEGQQRLWVTYAFVNLAPSADTLPFRVGMLFHSPLGMSSVITKTMLGLAEAVCILCSPTPSGVVTTG